MLKHFLRAVDAKALIPSGMPLRAAVSGYGGVVAKWELVNQPRTSDGCCHRYWPIPLSGCARVYCVDAAVKLELVRWPRTWCQQSLANPFKWELWLGSRTLQPNGSLCDGRDLQSVALSPAYPSLWVGCYAYIQLYQSRDYLNFARHYAPSNIKVIVRQAPRTSCRHFPSQRLQLE